MDTDMDAEPTDQPYTTGPAEEGELSDLEQDLTTTDVDQASSEE